MEAVATSADRGWRHIERYGYVERAYEEVWVWLAGHLSSLGDPLPGGGRSVELRIRPAGKEVNRPVRIHVGGLVCSQDRARATLAWVDATHPHLFPQLEAALEIAPVPNDTAPFTQLGILARYRPPLGPLGAIGDRLLGADVTDAALTLFLEELADAVEANLVPPSLQQAQPERPGFAPSYDNPDIRRVLLPVGGLAEQPGGAVGLCNALARTPGIVHVSLNPFAKLIAVDHDPERCTSAQVIATLEEQVTGWG
jgi:hypothetical protein